MNNDNLKKDVEVILPVLEQAVLIAKRLYEKNGIDISPKDIIEIYMLIRQQESIRLLEEAFKAGMIQTTPAEIHKKAFRPGSN